MAEDFSRFEAKFSQMSKRIEQAAITPITLKLNVKLENEEDVSNAIRNIKELVDDDITKLAVKAAQAIERLTLVRLNSNPPGALIMKESGKSKGRQLETLLPEIARTIRGSTKEIGEGKAGFASRSELDRILITQGQRRGDLTGGDTTKRPTGIDSDIADIMEEDMRRGSDSSAVQFARQQGAIAGGATAGTTDSPYVHAWQIAEFGTGIFALPRQRTEGDTKVPGGGGAWYLARPGNKGPVVLGQKGSHFLFGHRQGMEFFREDVELIQIIVKEEITKLWAGKEAGINVGKRSYHTSI